MQKKNFTSLVLGTIGGILFGIGMCMTQLPEWDVFQEGIVIGTIGLIVLLLMFIVRRKMDGKPAIQFNAKAIAIALYAVFATFVFGGGMCLTMAWQGYMLQGIIIGVIGILLLLCLIPMCKGLV